MAVTLWEIALCIALGIPGVILLYSMAWLMLSMAIDEWRRL